MTAFSLSPFSVLNWPFRKTAPKGDATAGQEAPKVYDTAPFDDAERRRIVGDLIAAGACDSEYGVHMLMSVFPDQF